MVLKLHPLSSLSFLLENRCQVKSNADASVFCRIGLYALCSRSESLSCSKRESGSISVVELSECGGIPRAGVEEILRALLGSSTQARASHSRTVTYQAANSLGVQRCDDCLQMLLNACAPLRTPWSRFQILRGFLKRETLCGSRVDGR
jgi:hypothetical protein